MEERDGVRGNDGYRKGYYRLIYYYNIYIYIT